jgi:hypothetical protein
VSKIDELQRINQDKRFEINSLESKISRNTSDIDNLNRASQNQILKFGDYMLRLLEDIKQAHKAGRFKKMPKGEI